MAVVRSNRYINTEHVYGDWVLLNNLGVLKNLKHFAIRNIAEQLMLLLYISPFKSELYKKVNKVEYLVIKRRVGIFVFDKLT